MNFKSKFGDRYILKKASSTSGYNMMSKVSKKNEKIYIEFILVQLTSNFLFIGKKE